MHYTNFIFLTVDRTPVVHVYLGVDSTRLLDYKTLTVTCRREQPDS